MENQFSTPHNPPPIPLVSAKPIVYQNGEPNFSDASKKKLSKRLLELDLVFHVIVVVLLIGIVGGLLTGVFFPKDQVVKEAVSNTLQSLPVAKSATPSEKPEVTIDQQVISVDKAFNSNASSLQLTVTGTLKKQVVGFLPYWAVSQADNINISLLTAVSYFGLEIGGDGQIIKSSPKDDGITAAWNEWESDSKTTDFLRKLEANRIKTYVTFKSFNNDAIEHLVRSDQAQQTFIANALYQMSSKGIDGINIDFEYTGTPPVDVRDKFSLLVSNLYQEMKRQYPNSILTIDTFVTSATDNKLFDVPLLAGHSDDLIIMGYDFHTTQSPQAGPIAPLDGGSVNLTLSLDSYLEKVPANKLILAVPYYGYSWPTQDGSENSSVKTGIGTAQALSYAEISDESRKYTIHWDDTTQTPWYSYLDQSSHQWYVIHFDNTRSLGLKYDLVTKKGLQGIGIWSLGLDGRSTELDQLIADKFAQ